jgi:hypothetical protein
MIQARDACIARSFPRWQWPVSSAGVLAQTSDAGFQSPSFRPKSGKRMANSFFFMSSKSA